MLIQPPSDKTHAAGVPPLYLTPVFQPGSAHDQKTQNEPNSPSRRRLAGFPTPQTRKTNPISPPSISTTTKNAKRTQSAPANMQNEPNSLLRPPNPRPKCAKRTQFPNTQTKDNALCINDLRKIGDSYLFQHHPRTATRLTTQLCKTNPIYPTATIATNQKCETNPISAPPPPRLPGY